MNDSESHPFKERTGPPPEVMAEILSMGKNFNEEIINVLYLLTRPIRIAFFFAIFFIFLLAVKAII